MLIADMMEAGGRVFLKANLSGSETSGPASRLPRNP